MIYFAAVETLQQGIDYKISAYTFILDQLSRVCSSLSDIQI